MDHHCAVCGGSEGLLRDCKYCTGVYCPDHALPEKHNCPGVGEIEASDEWFLTPETDVPTHGGEKVESRPEPLDRDEIRTYGPVARSGDDPDAAADGSATGIEADTEKGDESRTADTGFLSVFVSILRFWS